jgi:Ni,Fe-hydrogenase I cytochrome b subunit
VGGLANVRAIHRFTMWWFIVFTLIHIYMSVWNSLRSGNMLIEGMVSGFKAEDVQTHPVRRDPRTPDAEDRKAP